jgi:sporulation protein YlmC with PRC-barrel domain
MMLRTAASAAALTFALGVAGAVAQTTAPQQRPAPTTPPAATEVPKAPVPGQIVVQDANTILAKDLIGQTVYAPDKAKIGSISDLILSKDAKTVEGFVIGVGGFLGIGEKTVALKMDRLQMTPNSGGDGLMLMMGANKEE